MIPLILVAVALVSYLVGTVSGPDVVVRRVLHVNVRRSARGSIGYKALSHRFGLKWELLAAGVDVFKSIVAVVIGGLLLRIPGSGFPVIGKLFAGFCLVLGDVWPIQRYFRGGKGVICLLTALWLADWRAGIFAFAVFIAVLALSQFMSLASLAACFTGVIAAWVFVDTEQLKGLSGVLMLFSFLVIAWRHRGNISRLLAKNEPKITWGRAPERKLRDDNFF